MACEHKNFRADCAVHRLERQDGPMVFNMDVRVHCVDCGIPFQFIGLPAGSSMSAPCVSVDGQEARMPIGPDGTVPCYLDEVQRTFGSQQ